jgi:alkane 1-monooxygenase
MNIRPIKYAAPVLLYLGTLPSLFMQGLIVWWPVCYAWVLIPLMELVLKPNESNLPEAEEELSRKDRRYDLLLYLVVPLQYMALGCFLYSMAFQQQSWWDIMGKILGMGLLCGTFGINVGHELGHRVHKKEQFMAKMLLLSSLYLHFFIEHNKGHHKNVATPGDPSTARYNEPVYFFYPRTLINGYIDAWRIAAHDARKKGFAAFSLHNEMLQFQVIQLLMLMGIYFVFGTTATLCFLAAAFHGILLLETVNYIEHYGLQRKVTGDGTYERTLPAHSWNSNHVVGRIMLFELTRHSDHHFVSSRKYQVLRHHDESPQMPTGYPGMVLLSLVPPAWFYVMNPRIHKMQQQAPSHVNVISPVKS